MGSGPGGIQASYFLSRLGIEHAVISADPAPGGMFRRFPFFQRLLSWTKPHAPYPQGTREYEWYDFNSLLAVEPENRAVMPGIMDGSSEFPSRPEMEQGIVTFAQRAGVRVRFGTTWQATSRDGDGFTLHTSDGDYSCRAAIFAVGVAEPWTPPTPGDEHIAHYVDTRDAESYSGKRLFIIGKQNSGFELASGLLQWVSRVVLASPRPAALSVNTHSLAGVRARYVQPFEDSNLGGGVFILNASIERVERTADALLVHTRRSDNGEPFVTEVDEVIAATGFRCPLRGPAGAGRHHLRPERAAEHDQPLPERHRAGHLLRRHHRPGRGRAQEVRHARQLRGGPRGPLQRAADGRAHGRDASSGWPTSDPRCVPRMPSSCSCARPPRHPSCGTRSRTWRAP